MNRFARLLLVLLCLAPPALAEKRVALVIGNSAYVHAPALPNPKNDAEALAAALKRLNFEVFAGTDLDKPAMERLLRRFTDAAEKSDVALAFYAGHGLQVNGRNYLVPVDARLDKESDLRFDAVPLEDVQSLMEMGQRVNILILDACRDNPLARNLARNMGTRSTAIGRGLGETKAGIGTLIVYATQPGAVALDGDEKNSPFTAALLKFIEMPGLEIRQVITRVRNEVITNTRDKQVPWDTSSLRGDFYFIVAPPQPPAPAQATPPDQVPPPQVTPPPSPPPPAPPSADNEALFWQTIKDSRNIADFRAYLARFPNGTFSELAKIRIAELEKAAVTPPQPETPARPETPAPPPKPSPPRRTSTWVPGGAYYHTGSGGVYFWVGKIDTARQCMAACIRERQCQYWFHRGPADRDCVLSDKIASRTHVGGEYVSGEIRVVPGTPAQPGAQPGATTPPPRTVTDGQALVRELMRKANAGEAENGFCARTNWPPILSLQQAAASYDRDIVGTTRLFYHKHTNPGCGYARTTAVTNENGKRCLTFNWWQCLVGAKCNYANYKLCKNPSTGAYEY